MNRPNEELIVADADRVREEYARRAADPRLQRYIRRVAPATQRAAADRQARLLRVIDRAGGRDRVDAIELGCGTGEDLAALVTSGMSPERLTGVDLLADSVATAKREVPGATILVANAADVPVPDGSFKVAYQSVMLSSVTDPSVRSAIAAEMVRIVAPGGFIVSYDLTAVIDRNPHLVAIDRPELKRLFPGMRMEVSRVTLAVPVASRVPTRIASALEMVPFLRGHLFAVIERP